jgi:hypothetical protein
VWGYQIIGSGLGWDIWRLGGDMLGAKWIVGKTKLESGACATLYFEDRPTAQWKVDFTVGNMISMRLTLPVAVLAGIGW